MLYTVEGIVIRSMDYGEGNKILTLYTREAGKAAVVARGAKKVNSRHCAISQLFTYGYYTFFKSSASQMGTLSSGEIVNSHHLLREDLYQTAYASYLAELVHRVLEDQEGGEALFNQFAAALDAMEEGKDTAVVTHLFEMKLLAEAGYQPVLGQCVSCGTPAAEIESPVLSPAMGGLLCSRCRHLDAAGLKLDAPVLKLLRLFQQVDLRRLGSVEVKNSTKAQLKQAMRAFMDAHIGVQWKARTVLDQLEKYNV
jgi:DNA repair protein RecO (recombination protein O)